MTLLALQRQWRFLSHFVVWILKPLITVASVTYCASMLYFLLSLLFHLQAFLIMILVLCGILYFRCFVNVIKLVLTALLGRRVMIIWHPNEMITLPLTEVVFLWKLSNHHGQRLLIQAPLEIRQLLLLQYSRLHQMPAVFPSMGFILEAALWFSCCILLTSNFKT